MKVMKLRTCKDKDMETSLVIDPKLCGNCAQNFHTRKRGETPVFTQWKHWSEIG